MALALKAEVSEFIEQLNSTLPGSINSPAGKALVRHVTRITRAEFDRLERAIPMTQIARLTNAQIAFQGDAPATQSDFQNTRDRVADILAPITQSDRYFDRMSQAGALAFNEAATQVEESFRRDFDIRETHVVAGLRDLPVPTQIVELSRQHMARRVVGINQTSRRRLSNVIADQIVNQGASGVPGVQRRIAQEFTSWSRSRAGLVANTEINDMMSFGAWSKADSMGATEKAWLTVGDDDVSTAICLPNETQGKIGMKENFNSGHPFPSGHPRCRCSLSTFGASSASAARGLSPAGRTSWLMTLGTSLLIGGIVTPILQEEE